MTRTLLRLAAVAAIAALPLASPLRAQDKPADKPARPFEKYVEKFPGQGGLIEFDMVPIPAGKFKMNVDGEQKEVQVKRFWIGRTEVTWDEFDVFRHGWDLPSEEARLGAIEAKTRPSRPYGKEPDAEFGHAGYPVISVHLNAARHYCKWLSEKTGRKYRLPTEAEWEWACRGGLSEDQLKSLDESAVQKQAWVKENATPQGGDEPQTHPVGTREPNGYGLYDMLGNATEWIDDAASEAAPVTRGGSYRNTARGTTPFLRMKYSEKWQERDPQIPKSQWWLSDGPFVTFRVVCEE